jgi:hypothetical protein
MYGAIPSQARPGKKGRSMATVALAGLAAVAFIGAIASQKYSHASSPVALASPGWFSAIEDQFSDDSTSAKDKAIRMQLAAGEAVVKPVLPKGSITTAGYTDGLTGTRLDKLTAAGDRYVQDKKPQASLLARHGVEMDHWPWEDKKGSITQLAKQDSLVGDLMGAFADSPHKNPLLTKSQLQALEAKQAKEVSHRASVSSRRGIPQKHIEHLALEKSAMRRSAMLAKVQTARHTDRGKMAKSDVRAVLPRKKSPLLQLEGEEGDAPWGVDVPWNGHNDRCTDTNCNALGKRGDGAPGVHVYGWPWNEDTTQSMKQKQLALELQSDATQLLSLTSASTGDADAEEKMAQALEAHSFDLVKLASLQKLDEDDVSNQTKTRWPMFAKWYWTPDSTEYLEKEHGLPVDQWPWEDCHGVDCKHAVAERQWERNIGQKLHQDANDMSQLADSDAEIGLFPKRQALEEEDAVATTFPFFFPRCL